MQIKSNVLEVLARTRRYRVDVNLALDRVLQPARWIELARQTAEKTIRALAAPAEQPYVPDFVRAVTAVAFNGLLLSLDAPTYARVAAQLQLPGVSPGRFGALEIADENLADFEQAILDWVENEKRWDVERDGPKNALTVREKAEWIAYILLSPSLSAVPATPGRMSEQAARDRLLPHVAEYLQRRSNAGRLAPETVDLWLRTVLLQWTATVVHEFPARLRAELHLLRQQKQETLL